MLTDSFKYFSPDPKRRLHLGNPLDWPIILKSGHFAGWSKRNYDRWLSKDVCHARHAVAIDEDRADFPRVGWGSKQAAIDTRERKPARLKQVWFAGCHSDIGGSYPESESRLSDIALDWIVDELRECVPTIQLNEAMLNRFPDPRGLQHREDEFLKLWFAVIPWKKQPRKVLQDFLLRPSVIERLAAGRVPQAGEVKDYRPVQLKDHPQAFEFFQDAGVNTGHEA